MRRGFKTEAEKASATVRQALKLQPLAPLDPWAYAPLLGVLVLDFASLSLSPPAIHQLTVSDSDSWSAMTLKEGATLAIVLNPVHALTRRRSDLMHELAHVELRHTPVRVDVSKNGVLLLSDYSEDQEQEADWYGAALLLPRVALVHHRSRGETAADIADRYGVSESLCEWRLRTTGVEIQVRRARGR
ncbi:MAG: ImmA/IrrE family metallo-endopeptidase [Beijerinckiaceae bacterium]